MAYLVPGPGDFCDLHVSVLNEMDHTFATLSAYRAVASSPRFVGQNTVQELPNAAFRKTDIPRPPRQYGPVDSYMGHATL